VFDFIGGLSEVRTPDPLIKSHSAQIMPSNPQKSIHLGLQEECDRLPMFFTSDPYVADGKK
jgi:hypothetical protein